MNLFYSDYSARDREYILNNLEYTLEISLIA